MLLHTSNNKSYQRNPLYFNVRRVLYNGYRTLCRPGRIVFVIVIIFLVAPWKITYGQASSGFTKVGSVAYGTNSFTDTTITQGQVSEYEVTASNAAGESIPTAVVTAITPSPDLTPSNTLLWTPAVGGGIPTTYNIYRLTVTIPNPPTALSVAIK